MQRVTHIFSDEKISRVFTFFVSAHFYPCSQTTLCFTVGADSWNEHEFVDFDTVRVFVTLDTVSSGTTAFPVITVQLFKAVPVFEFRIERKCLRCRCKLFIFSDSRCFNDRFEDAGCQRGTRYSVGGTLQEASSALYESRLFIIHFSHSYPP